MTSVHPKYEVKIDAPVARVWEVLSDFDAYPQWNPDVLFRSPPVEGEEVRMTVQLFGLPVTVPVTMETIRANEELRWGGGPRLVMAGSHYFKLQADGEGTVVTHGERFAGMGLVVLWPLLRRELERFYLRINKSLKARCES